MAIESTPSDASAGSARTARTARGIPARVLAFWQLSRPRIVAMVALTIVVGALAAPPSIGLVELANALVGTIAVVVGAIALNQRIERTSDGRMPRTAVRPLPSGRLSDREVTCCAAVLTVFGLAYLAATVNLPATLLAAASWLIYVWVYTPLKVFTIWQTPIGAIPGAMPALVGSAAAGATFGVHGLALFAIVYFWQFPHAMAIAWLYREEFGRAGMRVASVTDPSGKTAAAIALCGAILLLPASLLPLAGDGAGLGYALAASVPGLVYLASSIGFWRRRDERTARTLLRVSVVYLPVVLAALLAAGLGGR